LVNIDLEGVPARVALRRVLEGYGLTFAIVGDTVVVSTEEGVAVRQMRQHVSVNFEKVELAAALKQLARDASVNLALDPRGEKEASDPRSLQADDVPLETAVRLMAEMANLKPVRMGNVLYVTTKAAAQEL